MLFILVLFIFVKKNNMEILFLGFSMSDACAWYRNSGITHHLSKITGHNITVAKYEDVSPISWGLIVQYDIIFMQNPIGKHSAILCRQIKECGKKCWIDYDDNYFCLNEENDKYEQYSTEESKNSLISILKNADVVSVPTEYLRQCFTEFNPNIWVIPNAHNDFILKREALKPRTKTVFWRGGQSHKYDLLFHSQAMNQLATEFQDWNFMYMGYMVWHLTKNQNNKHVSGTDIILYYKTLLNICPSIMHVPLDDNVFNHCKSNIAFLEGSYAGALSIVPSYWNLPNTLMYSNQQEYFDCMHAALSGEVDIEKYAKDSWDFVQEYFLLSKINYKRKELIKTLE